MSEIAEKKTKTKLYVSRLLLDPTRTRVQTALSNPWEMHRLVCSGEGIGHTDTGRPLFRVESKPGARPTLLVQTTNEVRWDGLVKSKSVESYQTKSFVPADLEPGVVLNFHSVAVPVTNKAGWLMVQDAGRAEAVEAITSEAPTVDVKRAGRIWSHHNAGGKRIGWEVELRDGGGRAFVGRRGKNRKVPVHTSGVTDWVARVMRGSEVLELLDVGEMRADMTRHTITDEDERGSKIKVTARRITGTVRVLNPEEFAETLASGVGTCRAFGFGMVSVMRRWS